MRVAVTGSTGFIGQAVVRALRAAGHEPVRLVRPGSITREGVTWDPRAGTIDARALAGIDAAINLAGETVGKRWTAARKREIMRSRVDATTLLASAMASLDPRPRALVSGAAVGYYGDRGAQVLDEASGPGAGFLSEVVQAWEVATGPASVAGIRVVTIRTGLVLHPSGGLLKRLLLPFRLGIGGRLGDGMQYQSWITLDDHVRAILFLLEGDAEGPANLTAPSPVTNAELTRELAAALHRPAVMAVPRIAFRAAFGSELAADLLSSQRALPAALDRAGFTFSSPDLGPALRALVA